MKKTFFFFSIWALVTPLVVYSSRLCVSERTPSGRAFQIQSVHMPLYTLKHVELFYHVFLNQIVIFCCCWMSGVRAELYFLHVWILWPLKLWLPTSPRPSIAIRTAGSRLKDCFLKPWIWSRFLVCFVRRGETFRLVLGFIVAALNLIVHRDALRINHNEISVF